MMNNFRHEMPNPDYQLEIRTFWHRLSPGTDIGIVLCEYLIAR